MSLTCVPLLPIFHGDTKLDLKAIYKRPSGDLTSGLPLRRHDQWVAKGFEYVTLADSDSLTIAAPYLRAQQLEPKDYIAGMDDGRPTPWNVKKYFADDAAQKAKDEAELKALIEKYGVEMVESIKGITVPDALKPADAKAVRKVATVQ